MASNAESVSIWWRNHAEYIITGIYSLPRQLQINTLIFISKYLPEIFLFMLSNLLHCGLFDSHNGSLYCQMIVNQLYFPRYVREAVDLSIELKFNLLRTYLEDIFNYVSTLCAQKLAHIAWWLLLGLLIWHPLIWSLQLIWISGTHTSHPHVNDLQMRCIDLFKRLDTRTVVPAIATRVTCPVVNPMAILLIGQAVQ